MYRRIKFILLPKGLGINYLIFLVILTASVIKSQTFEKIYSTNYDDKSSCAIEISDGFIIALNTGDYTSKVYSGKYLKISQEGEYIDSINIPIPENFSLYFSSKLVKLNDTTVVGINDYLNNNSENHGFQIVHLSNDMDIIFDTIVYDSISFFYFDYFLTNDGNIVTCGVIDIGNTFFVKITDIYGNLLGYNSYPSMQSGYFPSTIIDIPQQNAYYMFIYWSNEEVFFKINKQTLLIEETLHYPNAFLPNNSIKGVYDTSFYIGGTQNAFLQNGVRELSFIEVGNSGNIINQSNFLVSEDTNAFYSTNSISTSNEKIFLGGSYNVNGSPPPEFYPERRWILINKINPDGSIIWQRFYKGEVNYMPTKVLATSDGGALILSGRYDWNAPIPYQRDLHILKVDSTGWYDGLTNVDTEQDMPKQILVYPNPATGKVHFVTGFYNNLELKIYDIQGNEVLSQHLPFSQTVDIGYLKPGLYLYLLIGENGFSEKGKILKK